MPLNLPPSYDLTSFIDVLSKKSETKPTAQALTDLLDVASAHGDLLFARELLHTIIMDAQGRIDHPSPYSMAVRGALLAQAILLYARAAIVQSKRKTFDIRSKLTPAQKAIHKKIDEYRNAAVAHFDRTSRHGEALWADERIVLVPTIPLHEAPVRPAFKRLAVRQDLMEELLPQTESALAIYADLMREKFALATSMLDRLLRERPELYNAVKSNPFDPLDFFSSIEKAEDFLGAGKLSGTLHELLGDE